MDKYDFIPVEEIKNRVLEYSDIDIDIAKNIFLNYDVEVIYITNNDKLIGVITPGDVLRCFARNSVFNLVDKKTHIINYKYSSISELNYDKIEELFLIHSKVNEVPVVKNGRFKGVIWNKKRKDEKEWHDIRYELRHRDYNDFEMINWYYEIIFKFLNKFRGINIHIYPVFPNLYDCENIELNKKLELRINNEMNPRLKKLMVSQFSQMKESECKVFFKDLYNEKYVNLFMDDMNKLSTYRSNGILKYSDIASKNFNVKNGYRIIKEQPTKAKKIFFFGGCIWFGLLCDDDHTIPSYLYKLIDYSEYEIVNSSTIGFVGLYRMVSEKISSEDIAIIFVANYAEYLAWKRCLETFSNIHINENWIEVYNMRNVGENLFNMPVHCNHIINERIASVIYNDIRDDLSKKDDRKNYKREALQDYFISWDMVSYYKDFFEKNHAKKLDKKFKKGAVVMNCNPFTNGHKYLIEQAAKQVDFLYIFVVQEDRSVFKFQDRINMVKLGVQNINNVQVLSTGDYLVSIESFPQYFSREQVTEIMDTSYDIHVFAEVVAKQLDITCRFVGEEPLDKVTKCYNETMARILPAEGIEFVEIPRAKTENNDVISASTVRRLISEKQYTKLSEYLPETTIQYIREHINSEI